MMRACLYLLFLISTGAWAGPDGRVSVFVDSEKGNWVGQRVLVHLDLKTNGFSFSSQRFNLPQIDGGVLVQTDSSTLKLSEKIDGESWQVLRYDLSFFSQRAGEVQIPPFEVRFNAGLGYGQPEASFQLNTEALTLSLKMPPGADSSQPVVTTPRLTIQEQWQPEQLEFKVGEALTRTISLEAADVSGIALPAAPHREIEDVDQLPKAPVVEDQSNRGTLTGFRRDQVSYLFKRKGEYTLPGGTISWWNPETETLEQYQLEARQIKVAPDPMAKVSGAEMGEIADQDSQTRNLLLVVILLLVPGLVIYWQWPRIQVRRTALFNSEPAKFKRAIRACRQNDATMAWKSSNAWLALSGLSMPAEREGVWQELQRAMLSKTDNWSGQELKKCLMRLRENAQSQASKPIHLKPLNP